MIHTHTLFCHANSSRISVYNAKNSVFAHQARRHSRQMHSQAIQAVTIAALPMICTSDQALASQSLTIEHRRTHGTCVGGASTTFAGVVTLANLQTYNIYTHIDQLFSGHTLPRKALNQPHWCSSSHPSPHMPHYVCQHDELAARQIHLLSQGIQWTQKPLQCDAIGVRAWIIFLPQGRIVFDLTIKCSYIDAILALPSIHDTTTDWSTNLTSLMLAVAMAAKTCMLKPV